MNLMLYVVSYIQIYYIIYHIASLDSSMQAAQKLEQETFTPDEEADEEVWCCSISLMTILNTSFVFLQLGMQP